MPARSARKRPPSWRILLDPNLATTISLVLSTVLFFLISLSTPIIRGVQSFRLWAAVDGGRREVSYGGWGYCITSKDTIDTFVDTCSSTRLGLSVDDNVLVALQANPGLRTILNRHLTSCFVLYPIATLFTLIATLVQACLFLSRYYDKLPVRFNPSSGRTLTRIFVAGSLAMFVALVVSAIEVSIVAKAKVRVSKLRTTSGNIYLDIGSAVWLTVVGTIIHFFNLVNLFTLRLRLARNQAEKYRARRLRLEQLNDIKEEDLINPPFAPDRQARTAVNLPVLENTNNNSPPSYRPP